MAAARAGAQAAAQEVGGGLAAAARVARAVARGSDLEAAPGGRAVAEAAVEGSEATGADSVVREAMGSVVVPARADWLAVDRARAKAAVRAAAAAAGCKEPSRRQRPGCVRRGWRTARCKSPRRWRSQSRWRDG